MNSSLIRNRIYYYLKRELSNVDKKSVVRSFSIALLLFFDASAGRLRILPPLFSFYAIFIIIMLTAWWGWKIIRGTGLAKTPISFPLLIYLAAVLISTIFSVNQRRSMNGLLATTIVVLIFFLLCDLVLSGWKPDIFIWSILIFVTLLLLQGLGEIIEWYWKWFSLQVPQYPIFLLRLRLFGIAAWPSKLVMLIYICLPIVVFKLSDTKSTLIRIIWICWIIIAEIVFIFSDTRGGMLAGAVVLAITIGWLFFRQGTPKNRKYSTWLSNRKNIFGSFFGFMISYFLIYWIWQLPSHIGAVHHGGGFSAGRFSFWQVAINIFREYPILGSGPMTYPQFYIQYFPNGIFGWVSPHAHNLILNTGAQLGILGLIALGFLLLSLFNSSFRSPKAHALIQNSPTSKEASLIIAIFAGLVGVLIHSMFDRLEETPHTLLPLLMLVVVGLYSLDLVKKSPKLNRKIAWVFFLLLFFSSVLLIRINDAQSHQLNSLKRGVENDWSEASRLIKVAKERDPGLIFYNEQLGYAYGAAAITSETEYAEMFITEAIASYQLAIEEYPYWGPNYVNLAELLSINGKSDKAQITLESIPQNWLETWKLPQILLAEIYQANGQIEESDILYKDALDQNFWLINTALCQKNNLCGSFAEQIMFAEDSEYSIHSEAIDLIFNGAPQIALGLLKEIPPNSSSALIWVDRAAAHCALNQHKECEYSLTVAERLNAKNQPSTAALFFLTKSNLLIQKDLPEEAIITIESYINPLVRIKNYENLVHQRFGFPNSLLPSIAILEKNQYDLLILKLLEDLYISENRIEDAEWARTQANSLSYLLDTK